jgi:hypothetical protein
MSTQLLHALEAAADGAVSRPEDGLHVTVVFQG